MRSTHWYVHWHGAVYAESCEFSKPKTESEFRAHLRDIIKSERLPRGTEVWPTTAADIEIVGRSNWAPGDYR